jgi:hypothetical protein
MSDDQNATPAPTAAPGSKSSLAPAAFNAGAAILTTLATDPAQYWGDAGKQQALQDLIRGEQAGANGPIGPAFQVDLDLPVHAAGYDISAAPCARSIGAEDRTIIDEFAPIAFAGGLGQRKFAEAIGYALTSLNPSRNDFEQFAIARGWSDQHIATAFGFYDRKTSGRLPAPVVAAPAAVAPNKSREDRKREIESMMYIRGQANPAYFSDPKIQAEYRDLLTS